MPHYNLSALSTDSFEHLIQALSLKIIGPGGVIFGAGPDGAREATFEGKMDYPSRNKPWNGYLVMQAKFLQTPSGDTKKDGDWVLDQLRKELAKFADKKRKLRKPEYYILCSNVALTSVWKTGSKDRIAAEFKKAAIGIKGFRMWDYDQINRFLDDARDVCQSYGGWILPGDVLSHVIEWMGELSVDFEKAITTYLQQLLELSLIAEQKPLRIAGLTPSFLDPKDRLEVCERLGEGNFLFAVVEGPDPRPVALAFTENPTRAGLLPVLRAFCSEGAAVDVPLELLRGQQANASQRTAAAVVSAAQKNLDEVFAVELSEALVSAATAEETAPIDALSAASANVQDASALAALALGLVDRLPADQWRARATAYDALDDVLRKRTSDFASLPAAATENWFLN